MTLNLRTEIVGLVAVLVIGCHSKPQQLPLPTDLSGVYQMERRVRDDNGCGAGVAAPLSYFDIRKMTPPAGNPLQQVLNGGYSLGICSSKEKSSCESYRVNKDVLNVMFWPEHGTNRAKGKEEGKRLGHDPVAAEYLVTSARSNQLTIELRQFQENSTPPHKCVALETIEGSRVSD